MGTQFELTGEQDRDMQTLVTIIGVTTKTGLLNTSLSLLEWTIMGVITNPNRVIGSIDETNNSYEVLETSIFF